MQQPPGCKGSTGACAEAGETDQIARSWLTSSGLSPPLPHFVSAGFVFVFYLFRKRL
ncbi:IQ calmodulin-binding motif [Musa troglodytarum]|uniref:IQ calmodulin-binding motif n=1 Tax=Musa troglodytarum TaxID=320322 RepID=A0A9E7HTK9_9LILI|nr:IQ calmodulin-binding motif [Musa troglodytarum]